MLKRIRDLLGRRGKANADRSLNSAEPAGDTSVDGATEQHAEPPAPAPAVHRGPRAVHQPIAENELDPDAVKIVRRLARFDHIAYLVGGCVRDVLLERRPKDFDIGTSATPRQVKRLFRNCRIIGRRFRLAHIYFQNGKIIEVATFRALDTDDETSERDDDDVMIRDDNVFGTPEEDALRRDFTINQLFYDLNAQTVLDHAGGLDDLRRRVVRTIGDPDLRFREDPVRILRAIKFAARLDFHIEATTRAALVRDRGEIARAAPPRVLEELYRFCRSGAADRSFELLRETSVLDVVLPELAAVCAEQGGRWSLLRAFLARFDHAFRDGTDVPNGEILASWVLPALLEPLGRDLEDGGASRPRGVDVRREVDAVLRPLAVRLRVARRDQEYARQLVATLHRMVPPRRMRGNARRGLLARTSFPGALDVLALLAERAGGDFRGAYDTWSGAASERPEDAAGTQATSGRASAGDDASAPRKTGRRSRRGRRSKRSPAGRTGTDAHESSPSPKAKPKRDTDLPPVWDDRYFFAALPTVPDASEGPGAAEPPETTAVSGEEAATDASASTGPTRRRRRRRRRGRGRSASGSRSDAAAEDRGEGADGQ